MCTSRSEVNNTRAGSPHWHLGSNKVGGNTSTIALSHSSGTEDPRAFPPPLIRVESTFGETEPDGFGMVGESPQGSQWESNSFATSRDDHRIGCVQHRLGGALKQSEDRWSVVSPGVPAPYQCQRASSSILVSSDFCQRQNWNTCSFETRQSTSTRWVALIPGS